MKVMLCDRCGKTFTGNEEEKKESYLIQKRKPIDSTSSRGRITFSRIKWVPEKRYDLCDECITELKHFLREEE